ncbi:hypothetical protein [Halalkalicoccus salilacus]|uniref:hypothetical protein n=1 Tax=Halalkalicoccus sp. GCM10025704 TaxID=3252662 RepID=UPI0036109E00
MTSLSTPSHDRSVPNSIAARRRGRTRRPIASIRRPVPLDDAGDLHCIEPFYGAVEVGLGNDGRRVVFAS